jgi:hypothetical protein
MDLMDLTSIPKILSTHPSRDYAVSMQVLGCAVTIYILRIKSLIYCRNHSMAEDHRTTYVLVST